MLKNAVDLEKELETPHMLAVRIMKATKETGARMGKIQVKCEWEANVV